MASLTDGLWPLRNHSHAPRHCICTIPRPTDENGLIFLAVHLTPVNWLSWGLFYTSHATATALYFTAPAQITLLNKKLYSRCCDSVTCQPTDAEIIYADVQNSTFSILNWYSSVEFGITGYIDPGWLRLAGSQDTDLSCHLSISTFCCTTLCDRNPPTLQTDRRTDVMLVA